MPPPIHTLDLFFQGRPRGIASFLVIGPGGPVLVESGPGSTLPALERALAEHGLAPADVRHVLLTHIHLDHAGAAGWWARQGAMVYVHQIGAPHLIDPARLLSSAQRIYGDQMEALWGELLPAPAECVRALGDGDVVEAAGLRFTAHDTPGHARHHLVYQLDDIAFAGDLGGIRMGGSDYIRAPTPPPEFDLEAWLASIERMRALDFQRLYLTHFGPLDEVAEHWKRVSALVAEYAERVRAGLAAGQDREAIVAGFETWERDRLQALTVDPALWPTLTGLGPIGMSVDGILRYWHKRGV
jgi:glyoxylase-like metal-dependent hydrolase (beta-lactamase superfamily II)